LKNFTKVDCAFHYWAEQNSKVLSQLERIVFAVTMTQMCRCNACFTHI